MNRPTPPQHRICLLFDLDCFYAQCERVRLGLPEDISLALLQWNSVLAVTYPARKFGIKRGDSWEAVAEKSKNTCWAIHLKILEKEGNSSSSTSTTTLPASASPLTKKSTQKMRNPYVKATKKEKDRKATTEIPSSPQINVENNGNPDKDTEVPFIANIEEAFDQIYKLPREEQLECQRKERNRRRFYHEGKACLERYRLASMRIFSVVLESLTRRLGGKEHFILERASIDEFYLDITEFCYKTCELTIGEMDHRTVVVEDGGENFKAESLKDGSDLKRLALQRACQVSHWIRQDVFETLGFTMSAGICVNKMMAKLAATYGKPNGQAVLYVSNFPHLLGCTKIKKVRHFGGKLGRQVLDVLQRQSLDPASFDPEKATMGHLQQVPLPILQEHFSQETASFIFGACRGVDNEDVRETNGALVKSITAFKSFPATSLVDEIQNWISLMANEVVTRVCQDSARNHRYPKTCTLNYTYYTTDMGKRPSGVTSTRNFRNTKSMRLYFPHYKHASRESDIVEQAMDKLIPILKQHALRGVGLSVNNFESRGCAPDGEQAISKFFNKLDGNDDALPSKAKKPRNGSDLFPKKKPKLDIGRLFSQQMQSEEKQAAIEVEARVSRSPLEARIEDQNVHGKGEVCQKDDVGSTQITPSSTVQQDKELAMKLQASFDREKYILDSMDRRRQTYQGPRQTTSRSLVSKNVRRIDSFFGKKK